MGHLEGFIAMSYRRKRPFVLYWSSLEKYENCPQQFLWYRGWKDIDLGNGLGRGKTIPTKRSEHHALMGDVIQGVIEDLYNKELWRKYRGADLREHLEELTEQTFHTLVAKRYIEYGSTWDKADSQQDLLNTCLSGVRGFLETMRHNKLLGVYSRCEVDLKATVGEDTRIGGRADFIIRREATREVLPGITILDGKNSKSKGKYTDPDQLRWYALCLYLDPNYQLFPDQLGFVYFRYPYGTEILDKDGQPTGEFESGVDWVPFTKEDLEGLAYRADQAHQKMKAHKFDPTPTPKGCKFCDFESVCPARIAQKEKNSATRRRNKELREKKAEKAVMQDSVSITDFFGTDWD